MTQTRKDYFKNYRAKNRERINSKQNDKRKCPLIREKRRKSALEYYYKNKEARLKYAANYGKLPRIKIKNALYHRITDALSRFKITKENKTLELTGCSISFLMIHIESKFTDGMNWENYGKGPNKWNIDHIIPCRAFDLTKIEEQFKCFHWSNLQPLWEKDNLSKLDKMSDGQLGRNINNDLPTL